MDFLPAERNITAFTLGPLGSENPAVQINRARFQAAVGMIGWPLLKLKQFHSNIVLDLRDTLAASQPVDGDGGITSLGGAALGIQTADCVPILIADQKARVVAAVHAGWRGTAGRIAEKAIKQIVSAYGVQAEDLIAVIGPHNAVCCYEVGEEVVTAIDDPEAIVRKTGMGEAPFESGSGQQEPTAEGGSTGISNRLVESLYAVPRGPLLLLSP